MLAAITGAALRAVSKAGTAIVGSLILVVSDADENLVIAKDIFHKTSNKAGKSLLSQVTWRIKAVVGGTEAHAILTTASKVYCTGAATAVKNVAFDVIRCTLVAIGQTDLEQALLIWKGILTNEANEETIEFVLQHKSDFVSFLIDQVEPAKLYATALSNDGRSTDQNLHGVYNDYNEFDLGRSMNRHTVICQLQRLAKSFYHIFLAGKLGKSLNNMPMNTSLRSDFGDNGIVILPPSLTIRAPETTPNHGEQWLFINGIGGEYFWLQLYCEKLRDTFNRDIKGIFNRSDGLFWDLVECAGERDAAGSQNLIQRTLSSRAAQDALSSELSAAFQNNAFNGYIVMIAYSQGCLLLRLVLQDFVTRKMYRHAMKVRLRVFTFGNPSIDWMVTNNKNQRRPLCEFVNYTEHFANERDFVARLGVVRTPTEAALRQTGYMHQDSSVFINASVDWIGHLFGTQYSLRTQEYVDGHSSKLLACANGKAMAA
ncbi:hypothetical protein TruAng_001690 [Truncatella angustata]|nr:hypothetical protein TruAng_001690 [Truncatella angustata]